MKLIEKLNRQYIIYSLLVLSLTGISLYHVLKAIVKEETDEKLINTYNQIIQTGSVYLKDFELYPLISIKIDSTETTGRVFTDTVIQVGHEFEEYRQLVDHIELNGLKYQVIVRESLLESEDIYQTLALIVISSFVFLLFLLVIINRKIANRIWRPFFANLEKLKQFSLQTLEPFIPTKSNIKEFEEMNGVLTTLTTKVISDYETLKKFSENASHELQTPLAIIRSKIEALLEENQLSDNQIDKVHTIYKTINRLSKINSGLLLLTKIENKQYALNESIDINAVLVSHMQNFKELIDMKNLVLEYKNNSDWIISANKSLLDILISNLIGNAIIHNRNGGDINIELFKGLLIVSNTSNSAILDSNMLFERFFKGSNSSSTGLGLAITKQICNAMGLSIKYHFENELHFFTISNIF